VRYGGFVLVHSYKEKSMDRLLTQAEVAERLRRPIATLRYWRYTHQGPQGVNIAGRVLYKEQVVERWLEDQFAQAEAEEASPDVA
jgi:hypothetical protein